MVENVKDHAQDVDKAGTGEAASGCCGGTSATTTAVPKREADVRRLVRDKYAQIARESSSCCGDTTRVSEMQQLGYTQAQSNDVPDGANLGLGCGNPLAHADLRLGETVLDLGSGAGIDAFLAAREVGRTGHVIGVDMTDDMVERARANAQRVGVDNVEFRLGEIENLPVDDASVDLIISNCVINLSPEKPRVFAEALRVLRPGGRMVVSDLTLLAPLPEAIKQSAEAYVGCVAGASLRDDYIQYIRDAGFADVEIVEQTAYPANGTCAPADVADAANQVVSVKVRARKP